MSNTTDSRNQNRASFTEKEAAQILGISTKRLRDICNFFDSSSEDEWEMTEGDFFEYESGQAKKRRFYEEGVMAVAKYLEEQEGNSILARIHEFFTHHRARVTRVLVQRRIIQATQDRSSLQIREGLIFLDHSSTMKVLGTNSKGMIGTIRRIEEESFGLEGPESLRINVDFAEFENFKKYHWSQKGIVRLAKNMHEKGKISKSRRVWVKAVADVADQCFEMQYKELESHEARVRAAKISARKKNTKCAVTGLFPDGEDDNPIELEVHHLFDSKTRPDLAAYEGNLLVINSTLHRNFHKWIGKRPCEPKDFIDYLVYNEFRHLDEEPQSSTSQKEMSAAKKLRIERERQQMEKKRQKLFSKLERLQVQFEGNRLLY